MSQTTGAGQPLMVTAENLDRTSDLDQCAQEPVHIIGHIQPHGMLFALSEPDFIVRQVSANVSVLLGKSPEALLGRSFEAVLGAPQFVQFRSLTRSQEPLKESPLRIRLADGALSVLCVAHRHDGVLVVELELQEGAYSLEPVSLNAHIRLPLSRLESASGITELSELAVREIRRLSGFDRVMVYRFDEEWNGEVIAESAVPSPESYRGLRYPASDIPAQARRLFLLNRLRAIADVDARPVPLVPETGPLTGRPLDLTFSFLRSPASVHLEYLRNMGVQSSLTVSIVVRQKLWGMIACHHAAPRHVDSSVRSVCELIGQVLGSQVALRMDNAALQSRLAFRGLLDHYLARIDAPPSTVFADCFHSQPLLELFRADGLVLSIDGVISVNGHSLEPAALLPVVARLRRDSSNGIASSHMLSALVPSAISDAGDVSGALYLGLSEQTGDYLLLLRRELVRTVTWAGNPDKSVNTDTLGRLHPRASFLAWQETVRGRSEAWSELELEGAHSLRVQLLQRQASLESVWSKMRFRFLADSVPLLVWTAKPDGSVEYCNQRFISYSGCSLEQWIDRGWERLVHPDDLSNGMERWTRGIASGSNYDLECRLQRASDGAYRWHHLQAFPLRNHKGEIAHWIGAASDLEEQKQASLEILRSRDRLQDLMDGATNVSIISTDMDGIITAFNAGAENLLGYTSEELVGRQTPALFHLESEVVARGLELTKESGKPVEGFAVFVEKAKNGGHEEREWTYVRKDGSHLTVNLVVTALRDPAGTVTGFLGVAMDVTARRNAESILRNSEEHFQLLVDAVQDYAMLMLDAGGHVVTWNAGAERMKGYTASEIIGHHFSCFYPPEAVEAGHPKEELRIAARDGRYTEEGWRVRKDGSRYWADIIIGAVYRDDGALRGFAKVIRDLTKRNAAEQELRTVARRQGLAIDALHAGNWDWDLRTNRALWDARMFEIYGIPNGNAEVSYELWVNAVLPEDVPSAEASLRKTIATKSQGAMEFRIRLPDGSLRFIQAGHGAILDDAGQVARVIGINIDTTDRKFNEDLEQQVADRTAELKAANQELEKFAYVASHDLKAPLRAIHNSAKWLEEDLEEHLTGETREHFRTLAGRVKRMEKLLDDLLEYARIGRATDNRYAEILKGDALLEDVFALLPLEGFTVEVGPGFANIEVCRMPLQQILMNLIGNAIKHHHQKTGKIAVTVENDRDFYAFAVKDDGPGIGAQFHDQIFEMFRTLRPRDQVEGSGMGLAMVRKHIEIRGGTLRLESAPGHGSTFRFTWPKQKQLRREVE